MRNSYYRIAALWMLAAAAAAPVRAQSMTAVTVRTVPPGLYFWVDGVRYAADFAAVWPAGSQHTLYIEAGSQDTNQFKTKFIFNGWKDALGPLVGNPISITADPAIPEYDATFSVAYAISLSFYNCPAAPCQSPGTVYVAGAPYTSDADIYLPAGSSVTVTATPNPGWVFAGFQPDAYQTIVGYTDTVSLNGPAVVRPLFVSAHPVNLATVPAGLQVMADGAAVATPAVESWGLNTPHTVGAMTQKDSSGAWWVFGSWSDGGPSLHTFTPNSLAPLTVTCNYQPGSGVTLATSPPGLSLSVDGRTDWPSYNFVWPVGETHQISAPQQVDAQGNAWGFSSWNNGGAATQSFVAPPVGMGLLATFTPMAHLKVTSPVAGLAVTVDGTSCATPCDVIRAAGTSVRVSAPANLPVSATTRQDFDGWAGGSGTDWVATLASGQSTITATYHLSNLLSTSSSPANAGSWTMQPASPDGFYNAAGSVLVSVAAALGYTFSNFTGDLSGSSPQGTVNMSVPRVVQANFTKVPYIAPAGVGNAAGPTPQAGVAPGSIVSIYGANLTASTVVGPVSPMAQTLGGVTVTAGSSLLPLYYVSSGQLSVQLPPAFPLGPATLTVSAAGQPPVSGSFTVVQDAPGLFEQSVAGQNYALAVHADGSPVTPDSPAQQGETLTLYGTGFGSTSTPRPEGIAIPQYPLFALTDPVTLQAGPAALVPDTVYALPGAVGVDVVQFHLTPAVPSAANANLWVTVNGSTSNIVVLPVQ